MIIRKEDHKHKICCTYAFSFCVWIIKKHDNICDWKVTRKCLNRVPLKNDNLWLEIDIRKLGSKFYRPHYETGRLSSGRMSIIKLFLTE